MNDLSTLSGIKALVNNTVPTGCYISNNAPDIRTACLTGFWDTKMAPLTSTGLFQIMGNKAIRNSVDNGGVLTFEIDRAITDESYFSDNRWLDPMKKWPTRLYFKCNTAGFPIFEYRSILNELELDLYGKNCSQGGFVYVNKD